VKKFKIKCFGKVNLCLRVIKKISKNYHVIKSFITFCDVHDVISISINKSLKDKIIFSGKFKKGISKKNNTISKVLLLLRKKKLLNNQYFDINIKKNIPHGSGLGGASSNAANLLNFLKSKKILKINENKKNKIARKIGFDVPILLNNKNCFLIGKKEKIIRLKKSFKLNMLIVYPNFICSTKKIYKKNRKFTIDKKWNYKNIRTSKKLINFLITEGNDLEQSAIKLYPKIKEVINIINSQNGCYFSRITGSGSACIGIFSSSKTANSAKKRIKSKFPKFWCVASKTI
jgi:4-diphosphocytidyl-2-C-methyl-D-erythritol kinase